jgi:alanine dehydrogenase
MIVGVPKEIKPQENRVALLPSGVYQLVRRGHQVLVEHGAGSGTGYPDDDYRGAGAEIVARHEQVFDRADMIVKVKEPLPSEYPLLRPAQILFTYLHLAASKSLTQALLESRVTGIAYETVEVNRRLPLLEPMSEIAGRMSIIVGGYFLAKHCGGNGVLLGGVPGVLPGRVVVIGGGTSGVNAARMATGLGADVTILEVDVERNALPRYHHARCAHSLLESRPRARSAADGGPADRRGARPRSESAEAHQPRHVARDETRQRARGYRDRSGRLHRDLAPDHAR